MLSGPAGSSGRNQFNIDNASLEVSKKGGNASTIRMYGSNNEINIRNGGAFKVSNPGNGTAHNGNAGGGNQGIHYTSGNNNSFLVEDPGSEVIIEALSGPAVDMGTGSGSVVARNGGYFEVAGRTSTAAGGIFNGGVMEVEFDNPLFMDFRNNRSGGGNIFNASNGSTLQATNSDLAVWRNGANLDGDPDLNYRTLDYAFSGQHFNTLGETSRPEDLNTETFGTNGLTDYSRMSSNNGRWAIVDELRVPTNADKKVYGRVSLPVGLHGSRPAWDDEATVTIEVKRRDGSTKDYTGKTVGHSEEQPGISIYGEEPRAGLFEIELEQLLEEGDSVRVKDARLTSGELTPGFEHLILTEVAEVFPIIPPVPAHFSSLTVPENAQQIEGFSENPDVSVTATHNGEQIDTSNITVESDGRFFLSLEELELKEDDEIQVFLRDNKGSAEAAGVVNSPVTNNEQGNINPEATFSFHDTSFEAATVLNVVDAGPVSPVDPLAPDQQIRPEDPPRLPEEQGLLSIDFISQFRFGEVGISADQKYYTALPQRLLNEDGTVNVDSDRPNYIQISDRRTPLDRKGWQLTATLDSEGFQTAEAEALKGARILLENGELLSALGTSGDAPQANGENNILEPGEGITLLSATEENGQGTWLYRFGNEETSGASVKLDVPRGATPKKQTYSAEIDWTLRSVPLNE